LGRLLAQPRRPALAPTGIGEAAACLESCLGCGQIKGVYEN